MKAAIALIAVLACLTPLPGAQAGEKELAVIGEVALQFAVGLADVINSLMQAFGSMIDWLVGNLGDAFLWLLKIVAALAKFAGEQTGDAAKGAQVEKNLNSINAVLGKEGFETARLGAELIRKTGTAIYEKAKSWAASKGAKLPPQLDLTALAKQLSKHL